VRKLATCLLALLLVGGIAEARRPPLDTHVHGSAAVKPAQLIKLAQREGNLQAGLTALGLSGAPAPHAMRKALTMMDLQATDHDQAYKALRAFRQAAFAGPHYAAWVKAAIRNLRRNAASTYLQLKPHEIGTFIAAARAAKVSLKPVEILAEMRRNVLETGELEGLLARHPEVQGIDILGAEIDRFDPRTVDRAIDVLAASGRPAPILRIHIGDGHLGKVFPENVNLALSQLVARSERTDLRPFRIVLAHVAHIGDVQAARRDLATLAARGVHVAVNVNPLSNLVYDVVKDVRRIDALKLGVPLVAGSDNVGSLAVNIRIVDLLMRGQGDAAARLAARSLRSQKAHYESQKKAPPDVSQAGRK
jgi:hypothetical protein